MPVVCSPASVTRETERRFEIAEQDLLAILRNLQQLQNSFDSSFDRFLLALEARHDPCLPARLDAAWQDLDYADDVLGELTERIQAITRKAR